MGWITIRINKPTNYYVSLIAIDTSNQLLSDCGKETIILIAISVDENSFLHFDWFIYDFLRADISPHDLCCFVYGNYTLCKWLTYFNSKTLSC